LKMINNTGNIIYSDVRSVKINGNEGISKLSVRANEFVSFVLHANKKGIALIELISVSGTIVYKTNFSVIDGNNYINVPLPSQWPAGLYIVRVVKDNDRYISKFEKL